MKELTRIPGRERVDTDQVLYNPMRRGIEYDLLPWCLRQQIHFMAYTLLEQGRLLTNKTLRNVAGQCGATPASWEETPARDDLIEGPANRKSG